MALKIRLARGGSKKRPYYRIVVADVRNPRDGRFIEKLGTYNPLLSKESNERVTLQVDRIKYWLGVGAKPTDRVLRFLDAEDIAKRPPRNNPKKAIPKKDKEEAPAEAPAEDAQAEAPAEAPAEEAPVEAPAEEAPAEEAPAEAPAEEAPAEAPAEEAQAEEAQAEEAQAEEAPAEAPAEDKEK